MLLLMYRDIQVELIFFVLVLVKGIVLFIITVPTCRGNNPLGLQEISVLSKITYKTCQINHF